MAALSQMQKYDKIPFQMRKSPPSERKYYAIDETIPIKIQHKLCECDKYQENYSSLQTYKRLQVEVNAVIGRLH